LRPQIEEILYTAMEDFVIDIMVGKGTWAQSVRMPVNAFTLVWATTKLSALSSPLRDRFGNVMKLDFYTQSELENIITRNAWHLWLEISAQLITAVAVRSRGTPRIANRLLKIVRDYQVIWIDLNQSEWFEKMFSDLWVDNLWLDYLDKKYLETLQKKFAWGPVGLGTLASSLWEEEATIEDVVEPYLLQIGFLERSARGRKLTLLAEEHLRK
jgi:Holliday junction DNA helicase RuvB